MTTEIFTQLKAAGAEQLAAVKTTDGQLWENAEKALAHQKQLNLKQAMYNFADNHFFSGMNGYDAAELMVEHLDELVDIIAEHKVA